MKNRKLVGALALILSGCSKLPLPSPADICAAPETLRSIRDQVSVYNTALFKGLAAFERDHLKPDSFKDIVAESADKSVGKVECSASIALGIPAPTAIYPTIVVPEGVRLISLGGEAAMRIAYTVVHNSDGEPLVRIADVNDLGQTLFGVWAAEEERRHPQESAEADPDTYPADAEHMPEANDPSLVSGNDGGGNDTTAAANEENIVSQP